MNFGLIIRQALRKANLPEDAGHLELAKTEANEIIQDLWYSVRSDFRHSRSSITTVSGSDEYLLSKHFDSFVKNTLQGPSTDPRHLHYKNPEDFFRLIRVKDAVSGDAYIYTFGDMVGIQAQLNSSSKVVAFSGLANKTTNNVNLVSGSVFVDSDFEIFTINDVGLRFKKTGDSKAYKIVKFHHSRRIELAEKYRGSTASNASYKIGDIDIHVNITGYVSGELESEDILLDGSTVVTTTKTFSTVANISKSDRTGGKITVQSQDLTVTLGVMAAGEMEVERQTVLLWPVPDSAEELSYRFFMKHPYLWLDTDRVLIPEKWHRLIRYKLEVRLREWSGQEIPAGLIADISTVQSQFQDEAEDVTLEDTVPDSSGRKYGDRYYYDHDDEPA